MSTSYLPVNEAAEERLDQNLKAAAGFGPANELPMRINDMTNATFAATSVTSARNPQSEAGFSRIDLFTVLGVLMVAGLLLTPALARTRVTDQGLQCRNNLRQLIRGWQMYADDNAGKLPDSFVWVFGYVNYNANNPDNTNLNYLANSSLGPYVKSTAVFKCPADMSQATFGTVKLPRVRSVSMSQSFTQPNEGHLEDGDSPPNTWRHYGNVGDMVLPAPASLFVLLDEHPDSVNDASLSVAMKQNNPSLDTWQDGPSVLHDGGCGFAFADGHSEIKRWTDSRTLSMKVTYTTTLAHGILQASNNDIQWVKDRTTARK